MSDDFPTFGRPTTATLIDSSSSPSTCSGSRSTIASSRSPLALPMAADSGNRVAEAQLVERHVRGGVGQVVELVHRQQDRSIGAAQVRGDFRVHRVEAFLPVDQQHHEVRLLHRQVHLPADGAVHRVARVGHQAAGIDQPEAPPAPVGGAEMPVARRPGLVGDDGPATADESVEQGGLPHVRAAHDGDGRHAHAGTGAASASVKW